MPDPLADAWEMFEKGSIDEAAIFLHDLSEVARARGRIDVVSEIENAADRMRARLRQSEREGFDEVLEQGALAARPSADARKALGKAVLVASPLLWFLIWLAYSAHTVSFFGNCGAEVLLGQEGHWQGGGYESVPAAAVMGAVFLVAGLVVAARIPRRRGTALLAGASLYVLALIVLWYAVAPAVWGSKHCVID